MRKVIITRMLPVTNHRGARIKAKIVGKEITRPYDYGLSNENNHIKVAYELVKLLGWKVGLESGVIEQTGDCVHVMTSDYSSWLVFESNLPEFLRGTLK